MKTININLLKKTKPSKVQGRSYTSNITKLLKHMDRLQDIQQGNRPRPIMVHMSPCNPCNLTCSFCCFANRAMGEMLTLDQMKKALDQFRELGALGLEFTGGGEPTLHPNFDEIAQYAHDLGFKLGVCTNGTRLSKIKTWHLFSWVRLGMYGFDEGYDYDIDRINNIKGLEISAAYVWDGALDTSQNPNITGKWLDSSKKILSKNFYKEENFFRMLSWVEQNKIPTRIAFNAIKSTDIVYQDIDHIRGLISTYEKQHGSLQYAFLSDFNFKGERRNDNCYMHMIKPFVFTDGNVYVCPSAELAPENNYQVNPEFKLCDIDGITDFYNSQIGGPGVTTRTHACSYCKYAMQNELIDDVVTETRHNEFT